MTRHLTQARLILATLAAGALVLTTAGSGASATPRTPPITFAAGVDYPAGTVTPGGSAGPIASADLDGDGKVDLVLANTGGGGPVVLRGTGRGIFAPARLVPSDLDASVVKTADFNSDGHQDIAAGSYATQRMTILLGDGRGGFRQAGRFPVGGIPTQFAVADFNLDGALDVVSSLYAAGGVSVLLGKGDGTFGRARTVPSATVSLAVIAADLNSDGRPDLVTSETLPLSLLTLGGLGTVKILLGDGDGTFQAAQSLPVGLMPEDLDLGDINEDGHIDIVAANALTNDLSILRGTATGRFKAAQRVSSGGPGVLGLGLDADPGVRLADFDRDHHLDLAVIQAVSNRVAISRGDGHGHFSPVGSYATSVLPEAFLAIDVNSDHCLDLVVPGNVPSVDLRSAGRALVSVYLNKACGAVTH